MWTPPNNLPKLEKIHTKFSKPKAREENDPAKQRGAFSYQVHPSRTKDQVRAYDSSGSGAKGTAVFFPDQYGSYISDKGIQRRVDALPITPLERGLPKGQFVVNIPVQVAGSQTPTLFNAVGDSAHSLHIESLWVTGWQVTVDLLDPATAALPAGPLCLEVKGDRINSYSHVFSNVHGLGHCVYLPWNLNAADAYTTTNDNFEPILIQRWKHGDGTLKDVSVQLRAPTAAKTPLTFTNAFITFTCTVSSWAK